MSDALLIKEHIDLFMTMSNYSHVFGWDFLNASVPPFICKRASHSPLEKAGKKARSMEGEPIGSKGIYASVLQLFLKVSRWVAICFSTMGNLTYYSSRSWGAMVYLSTNKSLSCCSSPTSRGVDACPLPSPFCHRHDPPMGVSRGSFHTSRGGRGSFFTSGKALSRGLGRALDGALATRDLAGDFASSLMDAMYLGGDDDINGIFIQSL